MVYGDIIVYSINESDVIPNTNLQLSFVPSTFQENRGIKVGLVFGSLKDTYCSVVVEVLVPCKNL